MNKWLKKRSNQISILLVGLTIFLLFNFILPGYEKLPYYQSKIDQLKIQKKRLKRYALHMKYHEAWHEELKDQIPALEADFQAVRDTKSLQIQLGKLLRKSQLRLVLQNIETNTTGELFDEVLVRQQLKGSYRFQMKYLKVLTTPKSTLVTTQCNFENLKPVTANPELLMSLEFKYILPKL